MWLKSNGTFSRFAGQCHKAAAPIHAGGFCPPTHPFRNDEAEQIAKLEEEVEARPWLCCCAMETPDSASVL